MPANCSKFMSYVAMLVSPFNKNGTVPLDCWQVSQLQPTTDAAAAAEYRWSRHLLIQAVEDGVSWLP
jgi:hypothetical protein